MSIVPTGWMADLKPAIGMVHLRPLPGSPACQESLNAIVAAALHDAEAIVSGGMDGLIVENFGDAPFFPDRVPAITVASMARVATEIRHRFPDTPLGINVLRNDGLAALAIAAACGANFVRVNVLTGARLTDQGIIQGNAHEVLRERFRLAADDIQIWADVQVKHSASIAPRPLPDEAADTLYRGRADGLIVSGSATGQQASPSQLAEVKQVSGETPVLVGSGVTVDNIQTWASLADGFIVGTSLKLRQVPDQPVDPDAVKRFVDALRR